MLALLYMTYKCFLSSENQPRFNRITLLAIYGISLLMPPVLMLYKKFAPEATYATGNINIGKIEAMTFTTQAGSEISITSILLWIYIAGLIVSVLWTAFTISRFYILARSGNAEKHDDYTIVWLDDTRFAPFSWWKNIFMTKEDKEDDLRIIEIHERAHIENRHFYDLVLSQFVNIILWYNPIAWLMQSELKAVHEYEADQQVLSSGCNPRDYQFLLIKKAVGQRFPSLANSLNHSKLKKRMTMMYSKKTSTARKARVLTLVPAAVLALAFINVPVVSTAINGVSATTVSVSTTDDSKGTQNSAPEQKAENKLPDKLPEFKGGDKAMMNFLMENIHYPKEAEKAKIQGRVTVNFKITPDGSVTDVEVMKSVPGLDEEAIRVVKSMDKMWIPAYENGKAVTCTYTLPVSFKLK